MGDLKVSVIVPVYNVENYLRKCLDSICSQTLSDIEIICIDDGSTDSSYKILEEYAAKDKRIIVEKQKNAGAGAARNKGLSLAKGKYLSFLDSDDFFDKNMLKLAYDKAESLQADFVVFGSDQYHTEKKSFVKAPWTVRRDECPPYEPFSHRQVTCNVFKVFVGWAWDKLYNAEFVREHNLTFQEQRTTNDMLFVFSATVLAGKIGLIPDILAHQRRDAKDSLSKTRENSWHCFHDALVEVKKMLESNRLYNELERDYINYCLHACLWNYNTLKEPTASLLKDKLIGEWFEEFNIKGKDREYFYLDGEYRQYRKIFYDEELEELL